MPSSTHSVHARLQRLRTPEQIQDYLESIPINYEKKGETCMSPAWVFKTKKAHCLEGALLAAAALSLQGEKPLIMNLKVAPGDDDHAVALFKRNGYWGAISKTNHAVLRYRDPIYKTLRELALSYFHEYFLNKTGQKTLRAYSVPVNLSKFKDGWIDSDDNLWHIAHALRDAPHRPLVPEKNKRYLRRATALERKTGGIAEWERRNPRT